MTCVNTITLGAYLLGALEPRERYEFEAHLADCETCRAELIRLAPLPGMLNQISLDDFADDLPPTTFEEVHPTAPLPGPMPFGSRPSPVLTPLPAPPPGRDVPGPDGPDQEVPIPRPPAFDEPADEPSAPRLTDDPPDPPLDTPGDKPRPRRYWLAAAAAAILVAVSVGGVLGWQALDEPPIQVAAGVTWSAASLDGRTSAAARLIDHEWGTEIQMKFHGLPAGRRCFLIVYDHDGKREVAGWWSTDHDPTVEIPGSTSFQLSKIDRLELRFDDKALGLTIPAPVR